jgi:DNA repair protein RadC
LLLRTGDASRDVLDVSRALLARCGGLLGITREDASGLQASVGVGPAKSATLLAACELGRRVATRRLEVGARIQGPGDVHSHFFEQLRGCPHERFLALLLDGRHRVMGEVLVSQGTLSASLVHPREVFRDAVRRSAAALVLVHNHPSGDPTPSAEDRAVTSRLASAGEVLGIRIVDHVVVAEHGYHSFNEAGDL